MYWVLNWNCCDFGVTTGWIIQACHTDVGSVGVWYTALDDVGQQCVFVSTSSVVQGVQGVQDEGNR
jgi:hypothetical protein